MTDTECTDPGDTGRRDIQQMIDAVVADARQTQLDIYYKTRAAEICAAAPDAISTITHTMHRLPPEALDPLVRLLQHVSGFSHIEFLQEFVKTRIFMPRTGLLILDIFNRSDVMLEPGIASMLLDFDNLCQRIRHAVAMGRIDASLLQDCAQLPENRRQGLLLQLLTAPGDDAARLLAALVQAGGELAEAALQLLTTEPSAERYALLQHAYAHTPLKPLAKQMKKAAHALRQKGVAVAPPPKAAPRGRVFQGAQLPAPSCYLSSLDAEGYRVIFMFKPVSTYETKVFNIILSYVTGLHDIEVITSMRKETQSLIRKLQRDQKTEFIQTECAHGAYLVTEACTLARSQGRVLPSTIAQWERSFSDLAGACTRAPIYDCLDPPDTEPGADQITALLDATDLHFWFLMCDDMRATWEQLRPATAEHTPPAITGEIRQDAFSRYFNAARCRAFPRILEEHAYLLYRKDNHAAATTALGVAAQFRAPGFSPTASPFCREIIARGFAFFTAACAEAATRLQP